MAWLCRMWIWLSVNHYLCKFDKPNCVGLTEFYYILGYGWSLLVFLIPWGKSIPTWGWQCSWYIKEHTGQWLGGTLQRHSFLRDKLLSKISILVYYISATVLLWIYMNMLNAWMLWFFFRCMVIMCICVSLSSSIFILFSWGLDFPGLIDVSCILSAD